MVITNSCSERDRLRLKTVAFAGGPTAALHYARDKNGNLTNIWSDTENGVNLRYEHDELNRITNVLANGSTAAAYGFDALGNVKSVRLGNGVTNLYEYDQLNRLTNSLWKSNILTLASFYYQLGKTGILNSYAPTMAPAVPIRI